MVNLRILKFEKLTFQNIFKILFMNNVRRCFYSFYKRPIFVAVEKKLSICTLLFCFYKNFSRFIPGFKSVKKKMQQGEVRMRTYFRPVPASPTIPEWIPCFCLIHLSLSYVFNQDFTDSLFHVVNLDIRSSCPVKNQWTVRAGTAKYQRRACYQIASVQRGNY